MSDKPKIFQAPGIIKIGTPRDDGGVNIKIETNELSETEIAMLFKKFHKLFGWVMFSANVMTEADIPEAEADAEGKRKKTPSQRLRAVMYVCYDKLSDKSKTFDEYYEQQMEMIINKFKDKLE